MDTENKDKNEVKDIRSTAAEVHFCISLWMRIQGLCGEEATPWDYMLRRREYYYLLAQVFGKPYLTVSPELIL